LPLSDNNNNNTIIYIVSYPPCHHYSIIFTECLQATVRSSRCLLSSWSSWNGKCTCHSGTCALPGAGDSVCSSPSRGTAVWIRYGTCLQNGKTGEMLFLYCFLIDFNYLDSIWGECSPSRPITIIYSVLSSFQYGTSVLRRVPSQDGTRPRNILL